MTVNELRIGNLFYPCDMRGGVLIPNETVVWSVGSIDKFGKIVVIDFDKPDNIYLTINDCSPIPLTEEWLQKFGFKESGMFYSTEKDDVRIDMYDDRNDEYCTPSFEWGMVKYFKKLRYVHELQNLYFVLTGNELQIK